MYIDQSSATSLPLCPHTKDMVDIFSPRQHDVENTSTVVLPKQATMRDSYLLVIDHNQHLLSIAHDVYVLWWSSLAMWLRHRRHRRRKLFFVKR
jgi:hypothetical protein